MPHRRKVVSMQLNRTWFVAFAILAACSAPPEQPQLVIRTYSGEALPSTAVAVFNTGPIYVIKVDGKEVQYPGPPPSIPQTGPVSWPAIG